MAQPPRFSGLNYVCHNRMGVWCASFISRIESWDRLGKSSFKRERERFELQLEITWINEMRKKTQVGESNNTSWTTFPSLSCFMYFIGENPKFLSWVSIMVGIRDETLNVNILSENSGTGRNVLWSKKQHRLAILHIEMHPLNVT